MSFSKKDRTNNIVTENKSAEPMTDDLNIKSHLNASLELNGITVSEELINRTLMAIRQQETDEAKAEPNKETAEKQAIGSGKALWLRNTRIIAGAAAAVIVIAVGLNFVSGLGKNSIKYDMDTAPISKESTAGSGIAPKSVQAPTAGISQDFANGTTAFDSDAQAAQEFALDEGTDASDRTTELYGTEDQGSVESSGEAANDNSASALTDGTEGSDTAAGTGNTDTTKDTHSFAAGEPTITDIPAGVSAADTRIGTVTTLNDEDATDYLSFKDIFPATSEEISSIRITDNNSNEVVTLTVLKDIQDFYVTMDQQRFTLGTQAPMTPDYTIEVSELQTKVLLFTMTIGDSVEVNSTAGNAVSESIYNPADAASLLKSLKKLYQ